MNNRWSQQETLTPKRVITLDIETVSLNPNNPDGALDAKNGRVACIGLLIDDITTLQPKVICDQDEKKILEQFWATITENDLLVGHNVLGFDLLFIRQRSWILGVRPPGEKPNSFLNLRKYYTEQVYDIMEIWTNWSNRFKGCGLGDIAEALGVGAKTGHGSDVAQLWANREYVKLMDYCMNDVWLSYQVYCRMQYREPLGVPLPQNLSRPQRELVMVPAQQKGPEVLLALQAPLQSVSIPNVPQNGRASSFAPSFEGAKSDKPRQPIFYQQKGTEVILSGKGIFTVKRSLKEIYRAWGEKVSAPEERPQRFVWHLRSEKFQDFAGYCQNVGVPLQAMGDGATRIRREA